MASSSPFKLVLFNFHDVVLLITAYVCLLFAFLLATRQGQKKPSLLLAAFLICHAAIPLDTLISFGEAFNPWIAEKAPGIFYLFGGAYWLDAPILLLFTRSLLYKDFRFKRHYLLFLLPFAYFLYDLISFHTLAAEEKLQSVRSYSVFTINIIDRTETYARELIRFAFFMASALDIYRYRKRIRHEFSNIEKIDFIWLNTIVIGFTILIFWQLLVMMSLELTLSSDIILDYEAMGLAGNYATLALMSLLIFFSLSHSVVFDDLNRGAAKEPDNKVKKISFTARDLAHLSAFMEKEKPYLNNELNISELAKLANINHRQLSVMMNQHFGRNFFEFINAYRIEEAKKLLKSDAYSGTNVLDIMFEVGFNSKATFNTFFKKHTGKTPSQYRKEPA